MKNKNKYLFLKPSGTIIMFIIIVQFTIGCNDFLEVTPREEIAIEEQFSTYDGALQALNGTYLKTEDLISSNSFIYADLMGGNLTFTPIRTGSNTGIINIFFQVEDIYNFNATAISSSFNDNYLNSYYIINSINNILFYTNSLNATTEQKNQLRAEALALRGFIHFNLLQLFSQNYNFTPGASHLGIVYADKTIIGGVDFPKRLTVAESYDRVVKDLTDAIALFTNQQSLQGPKYSFFNSINTKALLARVALQKRDWSLALTNANEVIATSGTTLLTAINYVSEWEKPNLPVSEAILEFTAPLADDGSIISSSISEYYKFIKSNNVIIDYGRYAASGDVMNLFEPGDIRRQAFIENQLPVKTTSGTNNQTFYFTKKFQDNPGTISIRLSEMYLILAEAQARLGNSSLALDALNVIRTRANIAALTTPTNLLEQIFLERRRELCLEGHLFFDIARYGKNVTRNSGCISSVCNLTYPNPKYVLPIPFDTLKVNENMIQNESY